MINKTPFLLPLSESVAQQLIDGTAQEVAEPSLSELSLAEVAALVLLQHAPSFKAKSALVFERKLAEILQTLLASGGPGGEQNTAAGILSALDVAALQAGLQVLPELGVSLMDEEDVAQADYLLQSGCWDFAFGQRHSDGLNSELVQARAIDGERQYLSAEQSRYYREIYAQSDDHIHIQGYAGTGKSTLIRSLLDMYESGSANVLVLADTQRQMQSLKALAAGRDRVTVSTYGELISSLLKAGVAPCQNLRMQWWDTSPTPTPDALIIKYLGIQRSGELSENTVVQVVRAVLFAYCMSADEAVLDQHIPRRYRGVLDHFSRIAVIAYASNLWQAYVSRPTDGFKPKIRSAHQLKWLTLNQCGVPKQFTHVVVDECHDLSASKLYFLEAGGQAVISVGDEYQNLRGQAQSRHDSARQRTMQQSIRSGKAVESLVNPIIQNHSAVTKEEFVGNPGAATKLDFYSGRSELPQKPALVLVKNAWGAFDWLELARQRGVKYAYLGRMPDLNAFVSDCIELYRHGTRARHGELFRFPSWQAVATFYAADPSFERVHRYLAKGYSQQHWERTKATAQKQMSNEVYTISFVETAKNHEFERVFMTENAGFSAKSAGVDDFGPALYLAVTRAQAGLLLPQSVRDWVEDIST